MAQSVLSYQKPAVSPIFINEDSTYYNKKTPSERVLKRIPLSKMMDLKIDYAFKQLFGSEKNKHITVVFLNGFLQKANRGQIKDITFLNTEVGRNYADDKLSRLDILVITDQDERINVEIQFSNKYNMMKRPLFYWSKLYTETLQKNMDYDELRPVISINILNYNMFHQTERFHTMYHLHEDEDKFKLSNIMEFHYIEMPKLLKDWKEEQLNPWNDILVRWLLLLGIVDHRNGKVYEGIYKELEVISMNDNNLYAAFKGWEELSMTAKEVRAYEDRLKVILDEEAYRNKMDKLKRTIANQQKTLEIQQKTVDEQQKAVDEQQKTVDEQERTVEERQRAVEERQRAVEERQRAVEDQQRTVEERQRAVDEQQRTVDEQRRIVEDQKRTVEENQRTIEKQQGDVEQIKQSLNAVKAREFEVEQRIKQTEKEAATKTEKEISTRLLKAGVDIELIAQSTGLSKAQVIEIQRDMK